jgi:hypothetical protein
LKQHKANSKIGGQAAILARNHCDIRNIKKVIRQSRSVLIILPSGARILFDIKLLSSNQPLAFCKNL